MMAFALGTRFRASGLIKGLRELFGFGSRLASNEPIADFGAGPAVAFGGGSGWATFGVTGWVFMGATRLPGLSLAGWCFWQSGAGKSDAAGGEKRPALAAGTSRSMAMIMERALIWPAMAPRVASWLSVASCQRRARIWSRPRLRLRQTPGSLAFR